jgi:hypothetical protein
MVTLAAARREPFEFDKTSEVLIPLNGGETLTIMCIFLTCCANRESSPQPFNHVFSNAPQKNRRAAALFNKPRHDNPYQPF